MDYEAHVTMPSTEFQRICRDLATIGETSSQPPTHTHTHTNETALTIFTVVISVNKTGVHFSTSGDLGTGNVTLKPSSAADDDVSLLVFSNDRLSLASHLCRVTGKSQLTCKRR